MRLAACSPEENFRSFLFANVYIQCTRFLDFSSVVVVYNIPAGDPLFLKFCVFWSPAGIPCNVVTIGNNPLWLLPLSSLYLFITYSTVRHSAVQYCQVFMILALNKPLCVTITDILHI